jgi:hypothetical protein
MPLKLSEHYLCVIYRHILNHRRSRIQRHLGGSAHWNGLRSSAKQLLHHVCDADKGAGYLQSRQ